MADILRGATVSHAPLSQQQTLAVFHYLQELTMDTVKQIEAVRDEVKRNDVRLTGTTNGVSTTSSSVKLLQEEVGKVRERLDNAESTLATNTAHCKQVQGEVQEEGNQLERLRQGQQVTNTNVHLLKEELNRRSDDLRSLRKEVEHLQATKSVDFRDKFKKIEHQLNTHSLSLEAARKDLTGHMDKIRGLESQSRDTTGDVARLTAELAREAKALEKAVADAEATKSNLELTNGVVMKIHTEHEEIKESNRNLENDAKKSNVSIQQMCENHVKTTKGMGTLREEHAKVCATQEQNRNMVNLVIDHIVGLQEGQAKSTSSLAALSRELEMLQNVASTTHENLKYTNAIVLPNLGAEGAVSPAAMNLSASCPAPGATQASTPRSTVGRAASQRSPRRRKETAWFNRNIGSVPDRNSWT